MHQSSSSSPFSSLAIWRERIDTELRETSQSQEFKLRLLLEQGIDCEQAVWGCLKDSLHELREGLAWGLLHPDFMEKESTHLYNQAATELKNDKNFILELAREHGLHDVYRTEVHRPVNHTLAGYSTLGELRFALLVWRANMARDLSLAACVAKEAEAVVREGYLCALELIHRCVPNGAAQFRDRYRSIGIPESRKESEIISEAVEKVQKWLREAVDVHHAVPAAIEQVLAKADEKK